MIVTTLITELLSYFLFAGLAYVIFYVLLKEALKNRIIQKKFENNERIVDEIKYSMSTIIVFTLNVCILYYLSQNGYTKYYSEISDYGIPYLFISAALMVVIHDTYFYWAHRLMHHPLLYRHVHLIHHKSTNPSPFAAYAFHPLEAFAEVGVIYVFAFVMPFHEYALIMFWVYMLFINVMGHLSVELFPKWFLKAGILKFHNSATHHNMHHKFFNYNYGLYLNVWDRIMKTEHPKYMETFEEVTHRATKLKEVEDQEKLNENEKNMEQMNHNNQIVA